MQDHAAFDELYLAATVMTATIMAGILAAHAPDNLG